jgi:hypothetical protein
VQIEVPGYTFHVLVTTLAPDPCRPGAFTIAGADSANRLKELKEDFGAADRCLKSFNGTEATFRLSLLPVQPARQFQAGDHPR